VEWAILVVVALLVLVIGRWILQWVRKVIGRVVSLPGLNGLWEKSGVSKALEPSGRTPANIIASISYAYLMVLLWLIAARIVKLTTIEDLLERLLAWIPLLLLAGVIVIISAAVANWAADLVRPFAADKSVPWLTWLVRIVILVFGLLFAFDILEVTFAEDIIKILVFASGVGLAIALVSVASMQPSSGGPSTAHLAAQRTWAATRAAARTTSNVEPHSEIPVRLTLGGDLLVRGTRQCPPGDSQLSHVETQGRHLLSQRSVPTARLHRRPGR
jgi:hypothetical protein